MIRVDKESHEFWWSLYDTHTLSAEKVLEVTEIAVPSVTQILKTVGLISSYPIPSQYAERGTEIHELTELVDQGKFLPEFASDEVYPYILSYEQFLDEHEVNILGSESMVFSEMHFYAGIYDRLCELDGDLVLVDIKTGGKERCIEYSWACIWRDSKTVGMYRKSRPPICILLRIRTNWSILRMTWISNLY